MDRLGADVRSVVFSVRHLGRPNSRCLGQRLISAGLSSLVGETGTRQLGLTAKREHSCPSEEYVRRLTGEIVR